MFEKIIYRFNGVAKLTDLSLGFHWYLLTSNLNCAKHNARSKHVEPRLGSSYASRSTSRSLLQRPHILVRGSFYVKPLLLNGIRHQFANPTADEPSTSINEVNASTTYSFDGVPLS